MINQQTHSHHLGGTTLQASGKPGLRESRPAVDPRWAVPPARPCRPHPFRPAFRGPTAARGSAAAQHLEWWDHNGTMGDILDLYGFIWDIQYIYKGMILIGILIGENDHHMCLNGDLWWWLFMLISPRMVFFRIFCVISWIYRDINSWLVVLTILKNINQLGYIPYIMEK